MKRILHPFLELFRYRELLLAWTVRDLKVRYKQSVLGAAWAILQPVSLMLVFSFIFTRLILVQTGDIPYPVFSYSALVPWSFFATSITFASTSLIQNINLVTKIYFPREILPLGAIAASFVDFLVAGVVFLGLMIVYRVPVRWTLVWVPLLIIVQIILTVGICLLTSSVMVFFRDVRFVIPLGLQLWMYATPIIYPVDLVPQSLRVIYLLNPMAGLVDSYRRTILQGLSPDPLFLGIAALISVLLFVIGYGWFKRTEGEFADVI